MNIRLHQVNRDVWKFGRGRGLERGGEGGECSLIKGTPKALVRASPRGHAGLPPSWAGPGPQRSPQLACLSGGGTPRLGRHPRLWLRSSPHSTGACETGYARHCSSSHGQDPSLVSVTLLTRTTSWAAGAGRGVASMAAADPGPRCQDLLC